VLLCNTAQNTLHFHYFSLFPHFKSISKLFAPSHKTRVGAAAGSRR